MTDTTDDERYVYYDNGWILSLPKIPQFELPTTNFGTSSDEAWDLCGHIHKFEDLLQKRAVYFRKQGKRAAADGDQTTAKLYHDVSEATKILVAKGMTWCGNLEWMRDEAYAAEEREGQPPGSARMLSRILGDLNFGVDVVPFG
ncbi:MAG: hypothetical protein Q9184_003594 [Pyrenodesmia sp. 2 TL-2023]